MNLSSKRLLIFAIAALGMLRLPSKALALPEYLDEAKELYDISGQKNAKCELCHTMGGGSPRNAFGRDFENAPNGYEDIESLDSDQDGVNNLSELLAGSSPGDPTSTASAAAVEAALKKLASTSSVDPSQLQQVDVEAGEFVIVIPPQGLGRSSGGERVGGPALRYSLGGAFDLRFVVPTRRRKHDVRRADLLVHVAELAIQAKVAKGVTLVGEMLLPLNPDRPLRRQFFENDHGFFYATFADLPYKSSSLWVGRYRIPYGIDAVLDGASNPLPTPVYRSLGRISDLAVMVKGYAGAYEYSVAISDGLGVLPDDGDPDTKEAVNDWPMFGRLAFDLSDWVPGWHASFSGYSGRAPRNPRVGPLGFTALTTLNVRKLRTAFSTWYVAGKLGLYLDVESGQDIPVNEDLDNLRMTLGRPTLQAFETFSLYGRARWQLAERISVDAAGHYYDPNTNRENRDEESEAELLLGGTASYQLGDQLRLRLSWIGWLLENDDRVDTVISQLLLEF